MSTDNNPELSSNSGEGEKGGGAFLPKWIKSKMNDKIDLGQCNTTIVSPPEFNDNFIMYYNIHRQKEKDSNSTKAAITSAENDNVTSQHQRDPSKLMISNQNGHTSGADNSTTSKFRDGAQASDTTSRVIGGPSVIRVLQQLVSDEMSSRGGRAVGGSVSMPVTPAHSPKLPPKTDNINIDIGSDAVVNSVVNPPGASASTQHVNRYFSGAFTDLDKTGQQSSWLLPNLLLTQRQNVASFSTGDLAATAGNGGSADKKVVYAVHPSEYREMNFLSPTSM